MNEPAPRPCPFCGSSDARARVITIRPGRVVHTVICSNCQAAGPASRSGTEAIAFWNRRVADAPDDPGPRHVHTRDCYDDAGPGAGGVSLICDKIEGVDSP